MPGPAAPFAIPLIFGGPVALGAAKAAASTFAREYGAAVSSLSLATVLARQAWKQLPSWVKEDEAFRSMSVAKQDGGDGEEGNQEVLSLMAVIEKFQILVAYGAEKIREDYPNYDNDNGNKGKRNSTTNKLHFNTTFLCYFQLAIQLKLRYPEVSNNLYLCLEDEYRLSSSSFREEDWRCVRKYLDLAVDAYEADTDKLRGKLESDDFFLVNHGKTTKLPPGFVGYFTAVSPERKILLIGVKGTSSLEDILTDCCGNSAPYSMEDNPFSEDDEAIKKNIDILLQEGEEEDVELQFYDGIKLYCHEGFLIAAKRLVGEVFETVEQMTKSGYKLILCGHSLGAGTACVMSLILQSQFPHLRTPKGATENSRIHVYTYGCPPVMGMEAAQACIPFITAVVNRSDIFTRGSLANLRTFLYVLRVVQTNYMEQAELSPPNNPKRVLKLLQKLSSGLNTDLLMTQEEVTTEWNSALDRILRDNDHEHHLYIPGKVLLLSKQISTTKNEIEKSNNEGNTNGSSNDIFIHECKNDDCDRNGVEEVDDDDKKNWEMVNNIRPSYQCTVTDGTTKVLRYFDIGYGTKMMTDHLTVSYERAIDAMISLSSSSMSIQD